MKSFLKDSGGVRPIKLENRVVTEAKDVNEEFGRYSHSVYQPDCSDELTFTENRSCTATESIGIPMLKNIVRMLLRRELY